MSWTDEKREENWKTLNNDVVEIKTVLQEYVKSTNKMIEKHEHFINGNGKIGAEVRIDRLEQAHGVTKWLSRISMGGLITIALAKIGELYTIKHG